MHAHPLRPAAGRERCAAPPALTSSLPPQVVATASAAATGADREQLRSPRNRTCCGLGRPSDFLLAQAAQPLLLLDSILRHSPLPGSRLLPKPSCPSRLSLGAPRQPRPARPRRVPGLVARLGEPACSAPPPTLLPLEPHVGRSAAAVARNRRKWPAPTRCGWLSAEVGTCDSFTRLARVYQSRKHNRPHGGPGIRLRRRDQRAW